ncbi:hypothetical protein ACNKHV_26710 [Shigella flexneri]
MITPTPSWSCDERICKRQSGLGPTCSPYLSRLSPRKLSTMKAPVIFANEVATGLFGHLVGAIAGG